MPTYTQVSTINISDNTAANPYPSSLTLSGVNGTITGVTVTLYNINHTYPDDIDILLVGPQGQTVILMSDVGGSTDLSGINLTFDDNAVNYLLDETAIASGTYKPTNIGTGDIFGTPAPTGTYGSSLSVFNGSNANGTWRLFVIDDASGDFGSIDGGWSLNITTTDSSGTPVGQATNTFNISPDVDVIVNRTGGVTDTTQTGIDVEGNAFISQSFATFSDSLNGNGLPDAGFFAANSYHPSIQLGYSNSDNGNNARLITTSTGSFTVNIPSGQYRAIHLAVTSTEASSNLRLILNYTDGTSETTTTRTIPDWFNEITESKDLYYLIDGLDRARADGTTFQNFNDPALFGVRFLVNSAKRLQSFTVEKTASSGRLVVFGATGVFNTSPSGNLTITGTVTENQTLTANNNLADADGLGTLNYQWQQSTDGTNWTNISGATNTTLSLGDNQVGKFIRVQVSYSDGQGTVETINSSATSAVTNVNDVPTGSVTLNGTAAKNQTLTANNNLADADGLGTLNYQWQQSTDGTNWTNISGATNTTLSLGDNQVGKFIRVQVTYSDGQGTVETINSSATSAVINVNTLTLTNSSKIDILDNAAASPYPSSLTLSGVNGTITGVTVTLYNINHTYPDDIDILLVGPQGQTVILMSDVGGSTDLSGINLTFDDNAVNSLPDDTAIASGTYKPTNIDTGDTFTTPAPTGTYGSSLSVFNGTNANGTWRLFVIDDSGSDLGSIDGGWSLNITTTGNASPTGSVTLTGTATENQTLTASNNLADADGLGTLNYQWQQSTDGTNWTNISGATNTTLSLGDNQVGKFVRI
ncbi:MAG: proprotein convertase P-domain-containing protein, partial [Microcystis panniformis]